ncbi:MAG: molybdenum cofactor biosynthesis protein MoaE [Planctomycetota bacterium]|nr:molybdenum cofactor biosynthesis protein MoaE [Planctomycetota bacterium]
MSDLPRVALVREALDPDKLARAVARPDAGAVVTFVGVTRDHHDGRRVRHLAYEAHEPLALRAMQELAAAARAQFGIAEAAVWHRLGRLEIGEASVAIAVSAAHRAAAFDACRWLIDNLKTGVPIFKHEHYADGGEPAWVGPDGKPVVF